MQKYFEIAYQEAVKAYKKNEIPVGAVIVCNDKVIAKSSNTRQAKYDILGHAEINCIRKAEKKIKDWRLNNCTMYVTLMPCDLCQMVIEKARIKKVYYLIAQPTTNKITNNCTQANECLELVDKTKLLLDNFFHNLRK